MTRKPTSRKKPVKEGDYEVIVKDTSPGAKVKATASDVQAISPDAAMKAAAPTGTTNGSEEVVVRKKDPRADKTDPSNHGVLGESIKNLKYPYRVGLPAGFQTLVESISTQHDITGGTLVMTFRTPTHLKEALEKLRKSSDPRARVVLEGIKRSI
jgi:hypothetical protein